MHKTVLKIFVLLLNCFVIFGLPFLKPDIGYRQVRRVKLNVVSAFNYFSKNVITFLITSPF